MLSAESKCYTGLAMVLFSQACADKYEQLQQPVNLHQQLLLDCCKCS